MTRRPRITKIDVAHSVQPCETNSHGLHPAFVRTCALFEDTFFVVASGGPPLNFLADIVFRLTA